MIKILFLISFVFFVSCSPQTKYDKIEDFYYQFKEDNFSNFDYIIVINEDGTCLNCNNSFAKAMSSNVSSDEVLFIVSGRGFKVDISDYIDNKKKNIIWDEDELFQELNLVEKCAVIELDNLRIKKITQIDADNVEMYYDGNYKSY